MSPEKHFPSTRHAAGDLFHHILIFRGKKLHRALACLNCPLKATSYWLPRHRRERTIFWKSMKWDYLLVFEGSLERSEKFLHKLRWAINSVRMNEQRQENKSLTIHRLERNVGHPGFNFRTRHLQSVKSDSLTT